MTTDRLHTLKEVDFGCWWTWDGIESTYHRWRVSCVESTSELYTTQPGEPETRLKLGHFESRDFVETVLEGWAKPLSTIGHNLSALIKRIVNL